MADRNSILLGWHSYDVTVTTSRGASRKKDEAREGKANSWRMTMSGGSVDVGRGGGKEAPLREHQPD